MARRPVEPSMPSFQLQVDRLVTLDYPRLATLSEPEFRERLEPLRCVAEPIEGEDSPSRVRFVLVVTRDLVSPYDAVPLLHLSGSTRPGRVDRNHAEGDIDGYHPIERLHELLEKNKCFMLAGSRRHDRRVPALWISERAPKLGWCWDGNPHTWLGTASAALRLG